MKRIAVVSDLHIGDYSGLWDPDYELQDGGGWKVNRGQEYLWECWQDLLAWYPDELDALYINGDIVAGENLAERGARLVTTDIKDQALCAAQILGPLCKRAKRAWVLRGTPYHENKKAEGPETLGTALKARKWRSGNRSGMWRTDRVRDTDVLLDISHEIPFGLVYMATSLEREGAWSRRDASGKGVAKMRIVVVRSHRHEYRIVGGLTRNLDDIEVSTPCFQIQTELAIRKSPNKLVPTLGAILLEIEEGENGIRILKHTYKHPEREIGVV